APRGADQPAPLPAAAQVAPLVVKEVVKAPEAPKTMRLSAITVPAGATVIRADTQASLGTTPLDLTLGVEAKPVMLQFSKPGYHEVAREVGLDRDQHLEVLLTP